MYINPRVPPKLTYPMSGDYDALIAHKHYEEPQQQLTHNLVIITR